MDADVSVSAAFATPAQVLWAAAIGSPLVNMLSKVVAHPNGTLVVVGTFGGELRLGGMTYPGDDDSDTFVAMLDPTTGDPLWVRPLGGAMRDAITSVAIAANGDLFIAGEFEDSINLGTGMLTSVGDQDEFVARLAAVDGHAIWAQQLGGEASVVIWDVAAHPSGDLLIAGRFLGTLDLGQNEVTSTGTDFDGYVARLDGDNGSSIWATSFFSAGRAETLSVVVDSAGDAYATGCIEAQVDFGSGNVNADGKDWYIVHLRGLDGNIEWANTRADAGDQTGEELVLDGTGRILLGGSYTGAPDLGAGPLASFGVTDVFVARFFPSGLTDNAEWSIGLGSLAADDFGGLAVDTHNQPVVTGSFAGNLVAGTTTLMPTGQSDAFVAKLSANGAPIWATKLAGPGIDGGESVATDAGDVIYATGSFSSTAVFGVAALESLGATDTYVVRLAP